MKLRYSSRLKGIFLPAIAALLLGVSALSCSSTSEGESVDAEATEENATNNSGDPLANNASAEGSEEGGNESAEAGSTENGSEVAATNNNATGGELNNLVNEGSADAAAPAGDAAVTNESAGADPFANQANPTAAAENAPGAVNNGTDPFAPANANLGNASAAPADGSAPVDGSAAPADGAAPTNVASTDASAVPVPPVLDSGAVEAPPAPPTANVTAQVEQAPPAPETNAAPAAEGSSGSEEAASAPAAGGGAVASAAGEFVPENGSKMPYYVEKGDSLASISQKIYGNPSQWRSLAEQNNVLNPDKIYAGSTIFYTLTDKSRSFADKYERSPKNSHTVAAGETLSSIAAKVLGSDHAWRTLWKMNPSIKDPHVLKVGQVIYYTQAGSVAAKLNNDEDLEVAAQTEEME
jgi:nucleoid-associated protein YgaU